MPDLYQPPSYQRPLQGRVVDVSLGEPNPLHHVAILRRGQEIIIPAYLDDPTYRAIPAGDDVQVARDAGGTWRIQRRTEYQLADASAGHQVKAGRTENSNLNYAALESSFRSVTNQVAYSRVISGASVTGSVVNLSAERINADDTPVGSDMFLIPEGFQLGLGVSNDTITTATRVAGTTNTFAITSGGVQADWDNNSLKVGARGDTAGNAVGVLCAPDSGLPASLELPVSGQAPNMIATLTVAELLQLASALQIYPSGLSGYTPGAPTPPPATPGITRLTAGTDKEVRRWRRDRFRLLVVWVGGEETTQVVRRSYVLGRIGEALGEPVAETIYDSEPTADGTGRFINYYFDPVRRDVLLSLDMPLSTETRFQFLALADNPITTLDIPAGVTVPAITDGSRAVAVENAGWHGWVITTLSTVPGPSAAPRQVVYGSLTLADGFRFGAPS